MSAKRESARGSGESRAERDAAGVPKRTVMVVESDNALRRLLVRCVRRKGFTVREATNAREALAEGEWHGGEVSLLITDPRVLRTRDHLLLRWLVAANPQCRILLVLECQHPEANDNPLPGFPPGRLGFIRKPFDRLAFTAKVDELLGLPRLN